MNRGFAELDKVKHSPSRWVFGRPCVALGSLLLVSICTAQMAQARVCANLPTSYSPTAYRERKGDLRCEGTYEQKVSGGPRFALLSLTTGNIAYDLRKDATLVIRVREPRPGLRIRAVSLPASRFYRLDADISASRPQVRVPVGDVLLPTGLSASRIGIVGVRAVGPGGEEYVPVSAGGNADAEVLVTARGGENVTNPRWRLVRADSPITDWQPLRRGLVLAGTPLSMRLLRKYIREPATLELAYEWNGTPLSDNFNLAPN